MSNSYNSEKCLQTQASIRIELGNKLPQTIAGRLEIAMELSQMTIKTGKPGRSKKLFSKKELRKLLGFI